MTTKQRELLSKRNMTPAELRAAARKLNITSAHAVWLRLWCVPSDNTTLKRASGAE